MGFHYIDFTQFLIILTTSIGLFAASRFAIDFFAGSIWEHKGAFQDDKYDPSRNFDKEDTCLGLRTNQYFTCLLDEDKTPTLEEPDEFVKNFRSLDGETLRLSAKLLLALYK